MSEGHGATALNDVLDPRLKGAFELAESLKSEVLADDDLEAHSFEGEEIIGMRNFHVNVGCTG